MRNQAGGVTVELAVQVHLGGTWGDDCTVGQVFAQAQEHALAKIRRALSGEKGFSIVEEPLVTEVRVRRAP